MIESPRLLLCFFFEGGGGGGGGGVTANDQRLEWSLRMRLCTVQAIGGTNIYIWDTGRKCVITMLLCFMDM